MFDLEEYEILIAGFTNFATEKFKPSTLSRYRIILDDYFQSNIIGKTEKDNYGAIFGVEKLSLLKRKSNNVRPSLLNFLEFLYEETFVQRNDYFQFQDNIKKVFASEEIEKESSIEFLTPNEVRLLFSDRLKFRNKHEEKVLPLICCLSFFYMFKQSDVINLKVTDVDLEQLRIRNVRHDKNPDLVEWLSINNTVLGYLKIYLSYRETLQSPVEKLLVLDGKPLDNPKINNMFGYFDRIEIRNMFGDKKVSQTMILQSMMLYMLTSTNGKALYQILLEQDSNVMLEHAFKEYLSVVHTENKNQVYERYDFEEVLPKKKADSISSLYSESNDINQDDVGDYDMKNDKNLEGNKIVIQRMVRDSKVSRHLKAQYNHECQLCGYRLRKANGEYTSEAHHIQPYNRIHRGDDNSHNLIVLCPNCHTQFDDLYYAIHPESQKVYCIFGEDDQYHLTELMMKEGHVIGQKYLVHTWSLFEVKRKLLLNDTNL